MDCTVPISGYAPRICLTEYGDQDQGIAKGAEDGDDVHDDQPWANLLQDYNTDSMN